MIINHLNTSLGGGAATAARRLHESLRETGTDSRFWYSSHDRALPPDATFRRLPWQSDLSLGAIGRIGAAAAWRTRRTFQKYELKLALRGRPAGLEAFTRPHAPQATPYDPRVVTGDIVHLHWIANLIDYPSFFSTLPAEQPFVWTLHDMNPFTGGCHYTNGCEKFLRTCGNCPQLGRRGTDDLSSQFFAAKRGALRGRELDIVGPSRWICRQAEQSNILGTARVHHIANGLDTQRFQPLTKRLARKNLGLEQDRFILGFGAETLQNRRKGFQELLTALQSLGPNRRFLCVAFGNGKIAAHPNMPEIKPFGYVADVDRQVSLYSAMDLFVMPSLEDNLPQTGVEAMACGTPVVAFDIGGVPDYVRPNATGLLATSGDTAQLTHHIEWMIDHPVERQAMGREARSLCLREFDATRQATKYLRLYESILDERKHKVHQAEAA